MRAIEAFSTAVETLKRNPVLFVAGFVVALWSSAYAGAQTLLTGELLILVSLGSLVVQLLMLFFVGGAYGMAAEGLDGKTRLGTLLSDGKSNFANLLAGTLLFVIVAVVAYIIAAIIAIVAAIAGVFAIGFEPGGSSLVGIVGLMVVVYLLSLLPLFFLQFYAPAIVVSGASPVASLKRSYALVRQNLLSTLGFDVTLVALSLVGSIPTAWLYWQWWSSVPTGAMSETSMNPFAAAEPSSVAVYVLSTLVVGTLMGTFFYTYHVAFYESCLEDGEDFGDGESVSVE